MELKTKSTAIQKSKAVIDHIEKAMPYARYRELLDLLADNASTTGDTNNEALINYTKLNRSRVKRLEKTLELPPAVIKKIKSFQGKQLWLVISESWCGDAAQSLPVMEKITNLNPKIELKVILRDEYPELMDLFLTNGTRSIPKLIQFDVEAQRVIGEWGPRPSIATKMAEDYKKRHGRLSQEFKRELQQWYNQDKAENIISDLVSLLH